MMDETIESESPFGADLWEVLGRYVSKESPRAEAEAVRRWLAEDPRREQLLASLNDLAGRLALQAPRTVEAQTAWRRFAARMDEPEVRRIPARRWLSVGLRAAAVVALASGGAWYWLNTIRGRESAGAPAPVAVAATYTTPVGRTDSIRLVDGSHVVLGPASRLTVAATYGSERRDVELAGEAAFEVVHDPARPFAVRIGTVVIQDLGTTFAVRDDGGEVGVVVTSGSVLLRNAGDSLGVELRAGDRGLLTPGGRPTAERSGATADDLAWTQGRLVFNGAPMSLVKSDLRRWYGIELQIADPSLAGRHLTAAFSGEPADQVLNMVGLALGARIERRGDTAIVRAR